MLKAGHVYFYVQDVKSTQDFYVRVFGGKAEFMDPDEEFSMVMLAGMHVGFIKEDAISDRGFNLHKNRLGNTSAGMELCLYFDDNVDDKYKEVISLGAQHHTAPLDMPWGQRIGWVIDCNGIIIGISDYKCDPESSSSSNSCC